MTSSEQTGKWVDFGILIQTRFRECYFKGEQKEKIGNNKIPNLLDA